MGEHSDILKQLFLRKLNEPEKETETLQYSNKETYQGDGSSF